MVKILQVGVSSMGTKNFAFNLSSEPSPFKTDIYIYIYRYRYRYIDIDERIKTYLGLSMSSGYDLMAFFPLSSRDL